MNLLLIYDKAIFSRKKVEKYKLDHKNRLTILNPLNKENKKNIILNYRIK
jgi:hypothetical protein